MIIDPDKKVEKLQAERESIYQSTQHPEHFENEGSEYSNIGTHENDNPAENLDYDRVYGIGDKDDKITNNKNDKITKNKKIKTQKEKEDSPSENYNPLRSGTILMQEKIVESREEEAEE